MNILPDWIVAIDENLDRVKRYDRISLETELGKRLKESDYDRLIVSHVDLLADTLRQAEIIADDSDLIVLGTQVKAIDILLAEVEAETREFRRLILVEDKLFVNPEARRNVLAQVLDYSLNLEEKLDVDALIENLPLHNDWLEENRDRIEITLHTSDYLLLICGDRIQERLISLVDRFVKRSDANPLRLTELCLVSMAFYSDGTTHLLVPNIVNAVIGAQRALTIRIEVRDSAGGFVEAPAKLVDREQAEGGGSGRPRGERHTEAEFFKDYWKSYGDEAIASCLVVLEALERSGIPGLRRAHADSGRPALYLDETPFGQINILGVSGKGPSLHDNLQIALRRHGKNPHVSDAITKFRRSLLEIPDARRSEKRVYMPVKALAENPKHLIDAIDKFVASLKGG